LTTFRTLFRARNTAAELLNGVAVKTRRSMFSRLSNLLLPDPKCIVHWKLEGSTATSIQKVYIEVSFFFSFLLLSGVLGGKGGRTFFVFFLLMFLAPRRRGLAHREPSITFARYCQIERSDGGKSRAGLVCRRFSLLRSSIAEIKKSNPVFKSLFAVPR
jgi:hypothetical protein